MKKFTINCRGKLLYVDAPIVMGILNNTPDSFYDGGKFNSEKALLLQTEKLCADGATIIDIGGFSTRLNAAFISIDEELNRIIPIIKCIRQQFPDVILSVDTFRSKVAEEAIENGVAIINDISGGTEDERIFEVAAKYNCPIILMHHQGTMQTMHSETNYEHLLTNIFDFFITQIKKAALFGTKDVLVDVGFGFSKTIAQNYELLQNLNFFSLLDKPILVGLSRKSMLYKFLNITPDKALNATTFANTIALQQGAAILRVHDVKEAIECIKIHQQLSKYE